MPNIISSKEDSASHFYRGRANVSSIADIHGMEMSGWKDRLAAELEKRGVSKRKVSLDSGNGPGYVHSILNEGKDPTIEKLAAVCAAVPVSLTYVLYGFNVQPEDEAILSALHESPEMRSAVLTLLRQRQ